MATNPTKAELAGELAKRLQELERQFEASRSLAEYRLGQLERRIDEQAKTIDTLREQNAASEERLKTAEKSGDHPSRLTAVEERLKVVEKVADLPATLAAHDQRLKALEKGNDRTWQLAPMVISAIAVIVAVIGLFVKK